MEVELAIINQNGTLLVDSRDVAKMVEKNHAHLMRDIQGYMDVMDPNPTLDSANFFIPSAYSDAQNQIRPRYLLTRKGCDMVANKMIGKKGVLFTATYVTRFEEMENQLKAPVISTPKSNLDKAIDLFNQNAERMPQEAGNFALRYLWRQLTGTDLPETVRVVPVAQMPQMVPTTQTTQTEIWYTTKEIAFLGGVSTNRVATIATKYGLRTAQHSGLKKRDRSQNSGLMQILYNELGKETILDIIKRDKTVTTTPTKKRKR